MNRLAPVHGLFGSRSLPDEANSRGDEAVRTVSKADADELLSRDLEALIDDFTIEFTEVNLDWENPSMSEPEPMKANSYQDQLGQIIRVPQVRSTVTIPLEGGRLLLTFWSHQGAPMMRPIEGTLTEDSLQLTWIGDPAVEPATISRWLDERRSEINRFLENNNRDVSELNAGMRSRARAAIERRRTDELNRRGFVGRLSRQ